MVYNRPLSNVQTQYCELQMLSPNLEQVRKRVRCAAPKKSEFSKLSQKEFEERWRIVEEYADQPKKKKRLTSDEKWEGKRVVKMLSDPNTLPAGEPGNGRIKTCVGPFYSYNPIPPIQIMFLTWYGLVEYYTPERLRKITPYLSQCGSVALRDLEWTCTNYAMEKRLFIDGVDIYQKYNSYRGELRKRHFEPFCKRVRICFDVDGVPFYTTMAQLYFMKFAIENGIVDFVEKNHKAISEHRRIVLERRDKIKEEEKRSGKKPRRRALVKNNCRGATMIQGNFNNINHLDDSVLHNLFKLGEMYRENQEEEEEEHEQEEDK